MPSTFKKCDSSVRALANVVLARHQSHAPLLEANLNIDYVFAYGPRDDFGQLTKNAINHQGRPAHAVCRIIPLKERVKGFGDAEVLIDGDWWQDNEKETAKQEALLDHELHHLALRMRDGQFCYDSAGRPQLRMRKHDVEIGWFKIIAERNGAASIERQQAKAIMEKSGQFFWPELAGPGMPAAAPVRTIELPAATAPKEDAPKFTNSPKFETAKPKKGKKK